jgi:bacillithiol biosynthesis cysteine-adding enzyme BshC
VTAKDSSSSVPSRIDLETVNLLKSGLLPPLVSAFVEGSRTELLSPVRFQPPGGPLPVVPSRTRGRAELARALAAVNRGYGHSAAEALGRKLADPATRVVITGQQPGLFGGPLYSLSKAVAAVRWAERLEREGCPAVALFWIATDDHDFRESSRATFFTKEGPRTFDLGEDSSPLRPMGLRRLGPEVVVLLERLRESIPGERFGQWIDQLGYWYRPESGFGEAFAALMVHLLGRRSPLLVDAMLPALKQAQAPWFRRLVEQRQQISEVTAERDRAIETAGFDLQVRPQPGASPLFLLHEGQRRRIEWQGEDRLRLRGTPEIEHDVEWLLEAIDREPEVVSAGVLARSAIQDAVFGTNLQVLGPGELAYLPQVAPLYALLEIEPPSVALRPQALVLEGHVASKLESSGLSLQELLDPELDLDAHLAGSTGEEFLGPARQQLEALLGGLEGPALGLDPDLEGAWSKTGEQMTRALETFSGRVKAASARRDQMARQRLGTLRDTVRPLNQMQERVIASAHYPGKYGEAFVVAMMEQVDEQDPVTLQVVRP